jgi:hypothetical protein
MNAFMRARRPIMVERLEMAGTRHLDMIARRTVISAVTAVPDGDWNGVEKGLDTQSLFDRIVQAIGGFGMIMRRQPVNLVGIVDRIAFEEAEPPVALLTGKPLPACPLGRRIIDADRMALTAPNLCAQFGRLPCGHPIGAGKPPRIGNRPEVEGVDPGIGQTIVARGPHPRRRPGSHPWRGSGLQLFEDKRGDGSRRVDFAKRWHRKSSREFVQRTAAQTDKRQARQGQAARVRRRLDLRRRDVVRPQIPPAFLRCQQARRPRQLHRQR